jgi:hypothetical protein
VPPPALTDFEVRVVSVSYHIQENLIYLESVGIFHIDEYKSELQKAAADPAFRAGMRLLIDERQCCNNRSSGEIGECVRALESLRGRVSAMIGIVVSDSLHYGLARMLSTYADENGLRVEVFTNLEDAQQFLSGADVSVATP